MARPRTPTKLKVVAGTDRPDRANANEPKPRRERPSPPSHISDRGRSAWAEVVLICDRMGVLTEADPVALEAMAEAVADLRAARASLAESLILEVEGEDGVSITKEVAKAGNRYYWTFGKGGPMRRARPEIADIADADRRLMAWLSKFGMTPADRSRVSASDEGKTNAFDAF